MGGSEIRNVGTLLDSRRAQVASMASNSFGVSEHRMELVKNIRGIDFVNDAASVNVNGIYMALDNLQKKAVWITSFEQWGEAGDLFADLMQLITSKISSVVFLGNGSSPSRTIIEGMGVPTDCANDMETAVRVAFYSAGANQEVLYCPGVPADTNGESIAQRGTSFKSALAQL